jgi:D-cysteine desulfhydrase family pyridoxal phosphate-dependent enzyme
MTEAGAPPTDRDAVLRAITSLPGIPLAHYPTPVERLARLEAALGGGPRLFVKRDDAIPFGYGGNKVRKLELVARAALAEGADTFITVGGLQSNHARVTAAAAARLGLRAVLVLNGPRPATLTGNLLLDHLFGADVHYVGAREERELEMEHLAERLRAEGRRPYTIPLGASTPLGAVAFARAIGELTTQLVPDVIFHSTSSAGTQAGLVAGCAAHNLATRVVGVSADDGAADIGARVAALIKGMASLLNVDPQALLRPGNIEVDDGFVGEGYGRATAASREAAALLARTEALLVDHTYTAKALAALIARVREGRFRPDQTVLFWHTGGQVGLFS